MGSTIHLGSYDIILYREIGSYKYLQDLKHCSHNAMQAVTNVLPYLYM